MKIEIRWDFSMLGKVLREGESAGIFGRIISKYLKSSTTNRSGTRSSRNAPSHQQLLVDYQEYCTVNQEADSFSALLVACRDQKWWESECTLTDAGICSDNDDAEYHNDEEAPKRSLSIREIRERMNSTQSTIAGPLEFEPGLKLLDNIRGGWKDMEMFAD